MCSTDTPAEAPGADVQTFASTEEFLAAIRPGMDLCTSDFTGWAAVDVVEAVSDNGSARVRGRRHSDGQVVEVPATELIDIRGGHCVRIDRVRATIDNQGWEVPAAARS